MTSGEAARIARFCIGSLVGGIVLAGLAAPVASAAPDCSPATVEATKETVGQQAQAYMDAHPDGNKVLLTASLQPRPQAEATLRAYATANPQEYAAFKQILAPLGTLQRQCGVQVVPAQFQWAFEQFIGG
jgi:hemophore-related protein